MTPLESFVGPRVSHQDFAAHRMHFLLPTLFLAGTAVLLVISIFLPYWRMVLHAPQYPDGLEVRAYLDHLEGDVREIDGLNHYIGMRPLAEAAELERSLSIAAVAVVALLVAGAVFVHTKWAAFLALPAVCFPAFFLLDLQFWLYNFGTNLDPKAPLSSAIDPFVPPVLGQGMVGQFYTVAFPAAGLWIAFASSLLILVGLYFHRRAYKPLVEHLPSALLVLACLWPLLTASSPAAASGLRISPADGDGALLAAIHSARSGDTITVDGGVWRGPFVLDRPVQLVAEHGAVLDGGGRGTVVSIEATDVRIAGFLVRGSGASLDEENSGIAIEAPRALIENNVLEDVLFGIYLRHADDSVLAGNAIRGKELDLARRGDAIRVWYSHGVLLEGNAVEGSRDVVLWYSERLIVRGNRVRAGRYGLHFMYCDGAHIEDNHLLDNSVGAFLMYSRRLRLVGNTISGNHGPSGYGVGLKDMDDAEVRSNRFVGNRVGIFLDNTPREIGSTFLAEDNLLAGNDFGVSLMPSVRRARFLGNSFVDNLEQVSISGGGGDPEANLWSRNHWSDYAGFDADGDGTGDPAHHLDRLFESLGDRRPELRMFLHSPATGALDLASRAFPLVRPQPKLTDEEPAMRPAVPDAGNLLYAGLTAASSAENHAGSGLLPTGSALVVTAVLLWLAPVLRRSLSSQAVGGAPSVGAAGETLAPWLPEAAAPTPVRRPLILVRALSKHYGDHMALCGIDFQIREGESVALWGPNGAGKTTALRVLLGVVPYDGEVTVDSADSWRQGKTARRRLGFVPQEVTFQADFGVFETLEFFARLRGADLGRLPDLLASVGLSDHQGKRVGELSGGLRQRLALATALVDDPPILLLDEPTANLDSQARSELLALLQTVKAQGKTLVFSSHRAEEILGLADRVIHLDAGRVIADGAPHEVLAGRRSELWLRPATGDLERARQLLQLSGLETQPMGDHLVVSVTGPEKVTALRAVMAGDLGLVDFDIFHNSSSASGPNSTTRPEVAS